MDAMMKITRKNKKGFTLVELIVVLVILAILAAILIPSMIGWIDKANDKSAVVEARTELLAAQTIVSENYKTYTGTGAKTALVSADITAAQNLAKLDGVTITSGNVADGQVTKLVVTSSSGKTVTYDPTASETYTVS